MRRLDCNMVGWRYLCNRLASSRAVEDYTEPEGKLSQKAVSSKDAFPFSWGRGATACHCIRAQSSPAISYGDLNKVFGLALTVVALDAVGLDETFFQQR